jgi:hypothetical protein
VGNTGSGDPALARDRGVPHIMRTMPDAAEQPQPRRALAEPHLPLARYRLDFRAHDQITLPPFQGAHLREALDF